jgi:hypothetical protein
MAHSFSGKILFFLLKNRRPTHRIQLASPQRSSSHQRSG